MQVVYKAKALEEFEQSVEWYSKRSLTATENFIKEVRQKIEIIKLNPKAQRNKYKHFFEIKLYNFPFTIVYFIDDSNIVITAFYHHKRNPKRKYD